MVEQFVVVPTQKTLDEMGYSELEMRVEEKVKTCGELDLTSYATLQRGYLRTRLHVGIIPNEANS